MAQNTAIGIVTLNDYTNYGNRLQNYALTKLIESEGFKVFNGIRVYTKEDWVADTHCIPIRILKTLIPFAFIKRRLLNIEPDASGEMIKRKQNFVNFTKKYTTLLEPITTRTRRDAYKALTENNIGYFISGSDQVWNPSCGGSSLEFLTFAPKRKRLSFAASIGIDEIPQGLSLYYAQKLREMYYISVRERKGAEIVKQLTGRDADVTLDPTLLLSRDNWLKVIRKPNICLEKKYICAYFLGELPNAVHDFAKSKGLRIYKLNSLDEKELYTIDPAEFLYMIQNATYVLTDSFHAVAFSIKFNKEFYVFDRKQDGVSNMFSRIETITKRFGLGNRIQNRDRIIEQDPIDNWNEIEDELMAEKKKSMEKLLEAMGI